MPNPSIYDILDWQQDPYARRDTYDISNILNVLQGGEGTGQNMSTGDILRGTTGWSGAGRTSDYLSDLLTKTGSYKDTLTGTYDDTRVGGGRTAAPKTKGLGMQYTKTGGGFGDTIESQELSMSRMGELFEQEGFTGMSEDELRSAIEGIYDPTMQAIRGMGTYNPYGVESQFGQSGDSWKYGGELKALHGMDEDARQEALYGDYSKWYGEQGFDDEQLDLAGFQESLKGGGYTPKYKNVGFETGDLDELISYSQAMQEGMGRVGSISERFDLGGQLAGEERGAEREQRKALEAYIPREVASRYGALQSGGGGDVGEAAEAKYLAGLSSAQRRQGRNVRSIYGELEDEMFGGLGKWIQNMTSS